MLGGAGGDEFGSETPVVTLRSFIDSLGLSEDKEDIDLVMQAFEINRIKVRGTQSVAMLVRSVLLCRMRRRWRTCQSMTSCGVTNPREASRVW